MGSSSWPTDLSRDKVPYNVNKKIVFFADSELTKGGSRSGEQLLANRIQGLFDELNSFSIPKPRDYPGPNIR
jgi:hypothetical protein